MNQTQRNMLLKEAHIVETNIKNIVERVTKDGRQRLEQIELELLNADDIKRMSNAELQETRSAVPDVLSEYALMVEVEHAKRVLHPLIVETEKESRIRQGP